MPLRVLLVGYYGKGNFGDDVLLCVTYRLVRSLYPDAVISIIVDGSHGGYITQMVGDATVLPPARHGHFDLIIHGGGGVFFDFGRYGVWSRAFERALYAIGLRRYVLAERCLRALLGKQRTSADIRVGLGIGVGTYAAGSPRLRERLPTLADFKALWVREAQSAENLKRFAPLMQVPCITGSDLAFLTEYWLETASPKRPQAGEKKKLGIALRDWPEAWGGLGEQALAQVIEGLAQHYDITGFILDVHADPIMQRVFEPYAKVVWRPDAMSLEQFAAALGTQDVLLTSRAHAAICGACVGTPSVVVAIEPKLQQVAAMLPHCATLVSATDVQRWQPAIEAMSGCPAQSIADDVARNRQASLAALAQVREVLP